MLVGSDIIMLTVSVLTPPLLTVLKRDTSVFLLQQRNIVGWTNRSIVRDLRFSLMSDICIISSCPVLERVLFRGVNELDNGKTMGG
jgi:hypothetical protein